jgi:hypothetical protein
LGSRIEYLRRLLRGTLDDDALQQAANRADRLSFAQIREAYIVASQAAFLREDVVTIEDLVDGIDRVRGETSGVSVRPDGRAVGFQGLPGPADRVTGPVNLE